MLFLVGCLPNVCNVEREERKFRICPIILEKIGKIRWLSMGCYFSLSFFLYFSMFLMKPNSSGK
jgi:hypothetical protein